MTYLSADGIMAYPNVTKEWAEQIALMAFPDIDRANFKVEFWYSRPRTFIVPMTGYHDYSQEEIELYKWVDAINMEGHYIGYGPKSNIFIIYQPKGDHNG